MPVQLFQGEGEKQHNRLFLLRFWKRTGIDGSLSMAQKTLQAMRQGGIYDHIGFGFHRYSTDLRWFMPHFEKMLYDQALLVMAYIETYQAKENEEYLKTAQETLSYVLRDMTAPEGGFYRLKTLIVKGKKENFYLWTYDEVQQVLKEEDANLIIKVFNLSPKGNCQGDLTNKKIARNNIFHMKKSFSEIASDMGLTIQEFGDRVENARKKLFDIREKRVHPFKDDKILTDWNGLMIAALAKAGQVFDKHKYKEAARRAADFIQTNMRTSVDTILDITLVRQFHTYSEPSRDPHHHTISTVYIAKAQGVLVAADDAIEARIFKDMDALPEEIAFDHRNILEDFFQNRY